MTFVDTLTVEELYGDLDSQELADSLQSWYEETLQVLDEEREMRSIQETGPETVPFSESATAEPITTVGKYGNLGIGYLVNGVAYKKTGTVYLVRADLDVFGLTEIYRDGGKAYYDKAKKMIGG